jgi:hypothetical protein
MKLAGLPFAATVLFHGKRRVKMSLLATTFAFLTGLTACGLASTVMELTCGRRMAFIKPYVSPDHVLRSLAATVLAGPFMLLNDALTAWRERHLSLFGLLSCMVTAMLWVLALGVLVLAALFAVAGMLPGVDSIAAR